MKNVTCFLMFNVVEFTFTNSFCFLSFGMAHERDKTFAQIALIIEVMFGS